MPIVEGTGVLLWQLTHLKEKLIQLPQEPTRVIPFAIMGPRYMRILKEDALKLRWTLMSCACFAYTAK